MTFDPLNILLLAVALIVFWRLKSVLGTRTGTEKPPLEPFEPKRSEGRTEQDQPGTVVRFPAGNVPHPQPDEAREAAEPIWKGFAEPSSHVADGLEELARTDPSFSPPAFLEGAKMAYEMIVDAFAKGDKSQLKDLLSKEVFSGFAKAIDERETAGRKMESRFVGIDSVTFKAVSMTGQKAAIALEFVSELISATYAKSGEVIDGDPSQIREVTEIWTFERDITSRDPNWKLVATQAPV